MADYHVNYLTGNDTTGDGSASLPWATISKAYTVALTADTIKVAGTGTTVLDTSASFTTTSSTTINTSVDLTSQLSVNDFIILSPNYSDDIDGDFNDWMTFEISAITSSTITLFGSVFRFPNQNTNLFTIAKHDTVIPSTGGWLTLTANGESPTIIGGWNDTFTSIIGLTVVQRTGLSAGSTANDCIYVTSSGQPGSGIKWLNFKAMKFSNFFYSNNLQEIPYVDNIHGATVGGWQRFYGFKGANSTPFKVYATNCGSSIQRSAGFNHVDPGYADNVDLHIFQHARQTKVDENCVVENFVGGTSTQSSFNAEFGSARIFQSDNSIWKGKMAILTNHTLAEDGWSRTEITGGGGGIFEPTSVSVVSDGDPFLYTLYEAEISNASYGTFQFIMPSGFSFIDTAAKLAPVRDVTSRAMFVSPDAYMIDAYGEWNLYCSSAMTRIDTTDYDTGDSSRVCRFFARGYAAGGGSVPLISFVQRPTGTPPTSVTFRIKYSGPNELLNLNFATSIVGVNDPTAGGFYITDTAGGWTDFTVAWPNESGTQQLERRLAALPDSTIQVVGIRGNDDYEFKIDSVTVNYV